MVVESVNSTGLNLAWLVEKRIWEIILPFHFSVGFNFYRKGFEYVH